MEIVGDDFSGSIVYFHIWKMRYAKWKKTKNIEKIRKKWRWLVMVLGGVFRVQCIFSYIEGEAVLNVRTVKIYGKLEMVGDNV